MALIQLTDPTEQQPQETLGLRRAAGIDLGTTNTLIATVDNDGKPEVIADASGNRLLPSAVHYGADEASVGASALERMAHDAANTIVSVKRLMGRARSDIDPGFAFPFAPDGDPPGMVRLQTAAGIKSPVEISAAILDEVAKRAQAKLKGSLEGVVITVPAYFDDAQRQATKDAAAVAGLSVLRLLNEPTAAALAYGLDRGKEGLYAVYDLGGGTFDISVLRLKGGVFEVLAAAGDSALGGDDYDLVLAKLAADKAGSAFAPDAVALRAARAAKEQLTSEQHAECSLQDGTVQAVTRAEFDGATSDLTARTIAILRSCLADAKLKPSRLKGVILVGGSTRMPAIKQALADELGAPIFDDLDPDEVVALGAASQADLLIGNRRGKDWLLLDVISLSLGIETMGGLVERIIPRNSSIPIARAQEFTTHKDGQTAMSIHVVQGERDLVRDCRSLARFSLRGLPPLAAGTARIKVTFRADADGLLQVSAEELTTGVAAGVEVKPSYGLSESEIAEMLREARLHASDDAKMRALAEANNEATIMMAMLLEAMDEAEGELAGAEMDAIDAGISELQTAMAGDDAEAVRAAVKRLNEAAEPFAQRRMEQAIREALAGRNVGELD